MTEAIIIALITGGFGFLGAMVNSNKNTALLQQKISELEKKQDKHNQLIERMYELEKDVDIAFERIKDNREDIDKIKQ